MDPHDGVLKTEPTYSVTNKKGVSFMSTSLGKRLFNDHAGRRHLIDLDAILAISEHDNDTWRIPVRNLNVSAAGTGAAAQTGCILVPRSVGIQILDVFESHEAN